jgi:hypothetical protein
MKYNLIWCEYCNLIGWSAWSKIGYTSRLVLWGHQCIHSPNQVILYNLSKNWNYSLNKKRRRVKVTGTGYIGKCISNYKITVVSLYKTPPPPSKTILLWGHSHQRSPPSYKVTPTKGHLSYKATPTKGHPSYKVTPTTGAWRFINKIEIF